MSDLKSIEQAGERLNSDDLSAFRAWFVEFDHQCWDEKIQRDAASGRLDQLADDALRELGEGRCRPL